MYTRAAPFADSNIAHHQVPLRVVNGLRPARPSLPTGEQMSDAMWMLVNTCWAPDPIQRPNTSTVVLRLGRIAGIADKSDEFLGGAQHQVDIPSEESVQVTDMDNSGNNFNRDKLSTSVPTTAGRWRWRSFIFFNSLTPAQGAYDSRPQPSVGSSQVESLDDIIGRISGMPPKTRLVNVSNLPLGAPYSYLSSHTVPTSRPRTSELSVTDAATSLTARELNNYSENSRRY